MQAERVLGVFFVVIVLAAFIWPSLRVFILARTNPFVLPADDSLEGVIGLWFRLVLVAAGAMLVSAWWEPLVLQWLGPIAMPGEGARNAAGFALLAIATLVVVAAQAQMGASWRIGIDEQHETALVTRGVFAISRNPIFLGMRIMLVAFFIVLPNAVTLAALALGDVLMQLQVRLEEAHLLHQHGPTYAAYASRTPRWLFPSARTPARKAD